MHRANKGSTGKALFTFTNLVPGKYRVYITWPKDPQGATNATWEIYNGLLEQGDLVTTDSVNQKKSVSAS